MNKNFNVKLVFFPLVNLFKKDIIFTSLLSKFTPLNLLQYFIRVQKICSSSSKKNQDCLHLIIYLVYFLYINLLCEIFFFSNPSLYLSRSLIRKDQFMIKLFQDRKLPNNNEENEPPSKPLWRDYAELFNEAKRLRSNKCTTIFNKPIFQDGVHFMECGMTPQLGFY